MEMSRPFGVYILAFAWAWTLGMFLALWGLFQAAMIVIGIGTVEQALIATGYPLVLLWYLNREPVRKAFGIYDSEF
jgi:hypothetical protein